MSHRNYNAMEFYFGKDYISNLDRMVYNLSGRCLECTCNKHRNFKNRPTMPRRFRKMKKAFSKLKSIS